MRAFLRHPAAPALGGFCALAAAIDIGRFAWTPILPYMVEEPGLDKSRAGLVASANFLGYFVGALAAAARVSKAVAVMRGARCGGAGASRTRPTRKAPHSRSDSTRGAEQRTMDGQGRCRRAGCAMNLHIENEETRRLAGDLAEPAGESVTGAIAAALRERRGRGAAGAVET